MLSHSGHPVGLCGVHSQPREADESGGELHIFRLDECASS